MSKVPFAALSNLKSKEPRLRDWNKNTIAEEATYQQLEIKRTSITRLKPGNILRKTYQTRPWNQKNLDYEIETTCLAVSETGMFSLHLKSKEPRLRDWNFTQENPGLKGKRGLEIKRTSITRLKPFRSYIHRIVGVSLKSKEPRLRDWNWNSFKFL